MAFSEAKSEDAVIASLTSDKDSRQYKVACAVIRHMHLVLEELEPSQDDWGHAKGFLESLG